MCWRACKTAGKWPSTPTGLARECKVTLSARKGVSQGITAPSAAVETRHSGKAGAAVVVSSMIGHREPGVVLPAAIH